MLTSNSGLHFWHNKCLTGSFFFFFLKMFNARLFTTFSFTTLLLSFCCRKGDPFQGPKLGSCLALRNELSEEIYVLTKQETSLGKGTRVESRRVREPRRAALPVAHRFYDDGINFWVVFGQSF